MSVEHVYNDAEMAMAIKGRQARNAIGHALGKAYPQHPWLVDVNVEGGIATISCPSLHDQYGMVLHLTHDTETLERKAVRMGGELLERYRVSREIADFSSVKRNVRGQALGGKAGGQ